MARDISLDTIRDAAGIYCVARRTPLIALDSTGDRSPHEGAHVHLKLETLQTTGSFKIRGAYNAVRQLTPRELANGVWTVSAGNAAQGVALAARSAGASCSVRVVDSASESSGSAPPSFPRATTNADESLPSATRNGSQAPSSLRLMTTRL